MSESAFYNGDIFLDDSRGVYFSKPGTVISGRNIPLYRGLVDYAESLNWGEDGPRTAQLALALLAHATEDHGSAFAPWPNPGAVLLAPYFAAGVIVKIPHNFRWKIAQGDILRFVDQFPATFRKGPPLKFPVGCVCVPNRERIIIDITLGGAPEESYLQWKTAVSAERTVMGYAEWALAQPSAREPERTSL
jgi:hypothetical protein